MTDYVRPRLDKGRIAREILIDLAVVLSVWFAFLILAQTDTTLSRPTSFVIAALVGLTVFATAYLTFGNTTVSLKEAANRELTNAAEAIRGAPEGFQTPSEIISLWGDAQKLFKGDRFSEARECAQTVQNLLAKARHIWIRIRIEIDATERSLREGARRNIRVDDLWANLEFARLGEPTADTLQYILSVRKTLEARIAGLTKSVQEELAPKPLINLTALADKPFLQVGRSETVDLLIDISPHANATPLGSPVALCLVLDCSKSMSGEPIEATKAAAVAIIEALAPGDSLSLIGFGTKAELLLEPSAVGDGVKAKKAVQRLKAKGITSLYGALQLAVQTMKPLSGVIPRIIVLTDGYPTDVSDSERFQTLALESFRSGIPIATVGLGNYSDIILRALSDQAGGWWNHLQSPKEVAGAFQKELSRTRRTVLRRPVLRIFPGRGTKLLEAHMSRPIARSLQHRQSANALLLDIPDIITGEGQEYILCLGLQPVDCPGVFEVCELSVLDADGKSVASLVVRVDRIADVHLAAHTEARPTVLYSLIVALEKGTIAIERGDRTLAAEAASEARILLSDPESRIALVPEEEAKARAVEASSNAIVEGQRIDGREAISRMRRS